MHVVIPVAGFGTRLRPHTYTKPKPLVQVAGNTVLGHILDMLEDVDVDEITFIVGYLGGQIQEYVEENYDFKTNYVEQRKLLGQAHAIKQAEEFVNEPVLIIFVDTIFDAEIGELPDITSDGVIFVKEVEDPTRFGVVTLDENEHISRFVEKPDEPISNLAVIGVYYLREHELLFDAIDELIEKDIMTKGEYFLADALHIMVERGTKLEAWPVRVWEDCGTPEAVLNTNRYLLENGGKATREVKTVNSLIVQPVHVAENVEIENSIVGPYVSLAEGCKVRNSIIRDTIADENALIADTMLDRSLIGKYANVSGRYRTLNVGDSSAVDFSR